MRSQSHQASTSSPAEIEIKEDRDHLGDKDVLGLDVPVQDVETMDVLHSQDNLESSKVSIS